MSAAPLIILLLGGVLGLSVGLIGTGSVLAVPLLVYGGGLDVHSAVCVSMLTMTLLGFTGTVQKLHAGAIDLQAATLIAIVGTLLFLLGGVIGFEIAVRVAHHFSEGGLRRLFGVAILMISVAMLVRLLAG